MSINLIDSLFPYNADHFAFGFKTKSSTNLLNFQFSLLDGKGQLINFATNEKKKKKKVPVLNFTIQILK